MSCRPTCIQPSPTNAHCGGDGCHHTFSGITAFDRHRRAGACLSPLTIGLHADRRGVWRHPGPDPTKLLVWPRATEDGPAPEVWSGACVPGGYVCGAPDPDCPDGICGMPVESEPCAAHHAHHASLAETKEP